MPQAAWEAMLADVLHPLGVHPRNLPAPQDHAYVVKRLRETPHEARRDGIRLWEISQSPTPHTHPPSPPNKRRRTDTGGTHSTPGALRATQHNAPDPPASGAATEPRYPANHHRGAPRQALPRSHQANRKPKDANAHDNGPLRPKAPNVGPQPSQPPNQAKSPTQIKPEPHPKNR